MKQKLPMHSSPKVALIYDWITTQYGGAEKVLMALHQLFPQAPLYTAIADLSQASWASDLKINTSFLQRIPGSKRYYRWLSWLMPLAFESFDLSKFDIVISITSAEAKGVLTQPPQLHLCYLLTPPRYIYSHRGEYLAQLPFIFRPLATVFLKYLEWWDQVAMHRPDVIVPISTVVAQRVKNIYGLNTAAPLYPPVEAKPKITENIPTPLPPKFYLILSRLVTYKRFDLAIAACQQLKLPLVIIGEGSEAGKLRRLAKNSNLIYFLGAQPDAVVEAVLQQAKAVILPGIEDFGITALEAQLAGKPVVVHQASGVAEVLQSQLHGIFLEELSLKAMVAALKKLESSSFDTKVMIKNAEKYATTTFVQKFRETVDTAWRDWNQERKK